MILCPKKQAPAPFARLRGEYRVQLLVKSRRKQMRGVIDSGLQSLEKAIMICAP